MSETRDVFEEIIVITMFHETIQGYLIYEKNRLEDAGTPDQFAVLYPNWSLTCVGGFDRYVSNHANFMTLLQPLADALIILNLNVSAHDALASAKMGIISNMNATEITINELHKNGIVGTKCL